MPDENEGERRQSTQRRESEDRIGKQFREDLQALRIEIKTGFAEQRLFIAEEIPRQFEVLGISTRTEDARTRACVICVCLSIRACASACARAVARVRRLSIQGPRDGPGKASPVCQGCGRLQWLGLG